MKKGSTSLNKLFNNMLEEKCSCNTWSVLDNFFNLTDSTGCCELTIIVDRTKLHTCVSFEFVDMYCVTLDHVTYIVLVYTDKYWILCTVATVLKSANQFNLLFDKIHEFNFN